MIILDLKAPSKGCTDCPLKQYISEEEGEYYICGVSGDILPMIPEGEKMGNCRIIDDKS